MPQISVTIAGRTYRMACGEGEEAHLEGLAARLDAKIGELKEVFGEIGDQRITVMAAITMADDLSEAERRLAALRADVDILMQERQRADQQAGAMGEAVATALDTLTARIERVAKVIATKGP